jgi:anti-anti-sigma factor
MERPSGPDRGAAEGSAESTPASAGGGKAGQAFSVIVHGGVHVIVLSKHRMLGTFESGPLGAELRSYIDTLEAPRVVLDLAGVEHLSSAALGMLVTTATTTTARGGRICLANLRDDVHVLLRMVKLDRIFAIHPSTDAAVRSLA